LLPLILGLPSILGGAAGHRCGNRSISDKALAAEGVVFAGKQLFQQADQRRKRLGFERARIQPRRKHLIFIAALAAEGRRFSNCTTTETWKISPHFA
jgi:hypothetical protein